MECTTECAAVCNAGAIHNLNCGSPLRAEGGYPTYFVWPKLLPNTVRARQSTITTRSFCNKQQRVECTHQLGTRLAQRVLQGNFQLPSRYRTNIEKKKNTTISRGVWQKVACCALYDSSRPALYTLKIRLSLSFSCQLMAESIPRLG